MKMKPAGRRDTAAPRGASYQGRAGRTPGRARAENAGTGSAGGRYRPRQPDRREAHPRVVLARDPRRSAGARLSVVIAWRLHKTWRVERLLHRVAHHVAAAEGFRVGELSIAVVGAQAMATLHERFMHMSNATDVLTFDLDSNLAAGRLDAEIVLCADVARRAARDLRGLGAARRELALYLVHGILHLAGYDDRRPADFQRMHAREDELLEQLGLGAVFQGRNPGRQR